MTDICVIYDSKDKTVTRKLVSLLRNQWNVWWAEGNISNGDWEQQVRDNISQAKALVPVLSCHTEKNHIFRDELKWAKKCNREIFPFVINETEMPFGFGGFNRTDAFNWEGKVNHSGFQELIKKIGVRINRTVDSPKRLSYIDLGEKNLQLPCFAFSLSSHETQISPKDGLKLLHLFEPSAGLVSSYDVWNDHKNDTQLFSITEKIKQSKCVLFLDSGNYEAARKNNHYSKGKNPSGWHRDNFRKIASKLKPDISFSFDKWSLKGEINNVINRIVRNYKADTRAIEDLNFPVCPIVHLPEKLKGKSIAECASKIILEVVKEIDPVMIAIPERELGDGLIERVRTVLTIRKELDSLHKYYPLHLLGTGNPFTIIALAAAGADSFDGLEWCRTVVDYDRWTLFHFQHFDFFKEIYKSRLKLETQKIIENNKATYAAKVTIYNLDFFNDLTKNMQNMVHSGNVEFLLNQIPIIGDKIFKEISK